MSEPVRECWMCHRNEEQVKGAIEWEEFLRTTGVVDFLWHNYTGIDNLVICPICSEIIFSMFDEE